MAIALISLQIGAALAKLARVPVAAALVQFGSRALALLTSLRHNLGGLLDQIR